MILKLLRESLGRVVIFIDWLTRPKGIERSAEHQAKVDSAVKQMALYQLYACPFCIKTRRAMRRLSLPIETRNVHLGSSYRHELEQGGGKMQVPCLRIRQENRDIWMYESADILEYLQNNFGEEAIESVA